LEVNKKCLANPHNHAHLQFTQANARPKLQKSLSVCHRFLADPKTNFLGKGSASIGQILNCNKLIMNEYQALIRGIKHWGLDGYLNICYASS
jgi:hypothetical protein